MNGEQRVHAPQFPSSSSLIVTLGSIALLSGLLVVLVYQATLPIITENRRLALERAIFTVIPGAVSKQSFVIGPEGLRRLDEENTQGANLYAGYDQAGQLVGVAMEGAAQGYQDVVRILYGYLPSCECIVGFTVLQSTETPGLGDKVETDPDFLTNFDPLHGGLDARLAADKGAIANPIETVKHGTKSEPWQIDAISGATVTSKAIGKGLRESTQRMLPLVVQHLDELEVKHGHQSE